MPGNNPQYTYQVEEEREAPNLGVVVAQAILFIPVFGVMLWFLRWLFVEWDIGTFWGAIHPSMHSETGQLAAVIVER